jgi:hypothetical protein
MKKVGVIKHERSGIEVPLRLNTETMLFEAVWERPSETEGFPERHAERGKDGEDVRDAMLKFIESHMTMTWEPVIDVVPLHENAQGEQVRATAACALSLTRFWLGRPLIGDLQQARWDTDEEHRRERSGKFYVPVDLNHIVRSADFKFPYRAKRRLGIEHIYLAYTEELWTGLKLIEQRINEARAMLEAMLGTNEALDRVAEIGAQLLPSLLAPPKEPNENQ